MTDLSDPHQHQAGAQLAAPYTAFGPSPDPGDYASYAASPTGQPAETDAMTRHAFGVDSQLSETDYRDRPPTNLANVPRPVVEDSIRDYREVVDWPMVSDQSSPWDSNSQDGSFAVREPPGSVPSGEFPTRTDQPREF